MARECLEICCIHCQIRIHVFIGMPFPHWRRTYYDNLLKDTHYLLIVNGISTYSSYCLLSCVPISCRGIRLFGIYLVSFSFSFICSAKLHLHVNVFIVVLSL